MKRSHLGAAIQALAYSALGRSIALGMDPARAFALAMFANEFEAQQVKKWLEANPA